MIPAVIEDHDLIVGAPPNWDPANGPCRGLPVRLVRGNGIVWYQSAWRPSPDEIEALKRGACVILSVSAVAQPATSLEVGPIPGVGEDTGLTYARAGVTPHGDKMEIWDEDRNRPIVRQVHEVNTTEGWCKVWAQDGAGMTVRALETLHGRFSIRWRV